MKITLAGLVIFAMMIPVAVGSETLVNGEPARTTKIWSSTLAASARDSMVVTNYKILELDFTVLPAYIILSGMGIGGNSSVAARDTIPASLLGTGPGVFRQTSADVDTVWVIAAGATSYVGTAQK